MKRPKIRALVLCAGFGTRLRPLTGFLPKPLIPVRGEPVVGHTLRRLADLGCEVAVLNLHHLAEQIPKTLGTLYHRLPLEYSFEEEIQGTLGALVPPRHRLAEADVVLLINGDSLCDWPFEALLRRHFKSNADVTLLLHRRAPEAHLGGGVALDRQGQVVQIRDMEPIGTEVSRHLFAGVHLISPRLLDRMPSGPGDIISEFYMPLLNDGHTIAGHVTGKPWYDLGTPTSYLAACLDPKLQPWRPWPRPRGWVSPLAEVSADAVVEGSVLEADCRLEAGVRVVDSVVLPGARLGPGCVVQESLIGPSVELAASTHIEKGMLNRTQVGHHAADTETVLGDLIYTPLG